MAIATRIFTQIVLMIIFCRIETLQLLNLHFQRTSIISRQTVNGFTDNRQVCGIYIIDACAVLSTPIIALTIQTGRINRLK